MGTIYIDRKNIEIKVQGKALNFYVNGQKEGTAPLNPLEKVVIIGNITLETAVLHKLAQNNISVLFLSGRNLAFRGVLHGRYHNNGFLRLKQYEKSQSSFALAYSRELIKAKLQKQINFLSDLKNLLPKYNYEITKSISSLEDILNKLPSQVNPESIRGLEGGAAHRYFQTFSLAFPPSLNFKARIKRPPGDPVNALLSLGYTLLHFEMLREIEIKGLDPTIGFYHSFDYGRESLACDLIEPFRPDVDRFILTLFREKLFRVNSFCQKNHHGLTGYFLKKKSKRKFFEKYEEWAQINRSAWREQVRLLAWRLLNE